MARFVLLGAPGSGKGVQARQLCERFKIPHISSGDIFREEISRKSPLGEEVNSYVKSGRLVPDKLVLQTMFSRLERPDCLDGFLLDGFPRTAGQAEELEGYLGRKGIKINRVFFLHVEDDVLVQRLTARRQCERCSKVYNLVSQPPQTADRCDVCGGPLIARVDDEANTVRRRLGVYQDLTQPLVAYYKARDILSEIDGSRPPEEVSGKIFEVLEKQNAHR